MLVSQGFGETDFSKAISTKQADAIRFMLESAGQSHA